MSACSPLPRATGPSPGFPRHPLALALTLALAAGNAQGAVTALANQPIFTATSVPGNLALALSVEYPTAISVANINNYAATTEYLGYFDPGKCYDYVYAATNPGGSYFSPASLTSDHRCSGGWSGNFLNWATMQTIDPFRWAMTGGYRAVDTPTTTILEKAWGAAQGGLSNFPDRGTAPNWGHYIAPSEIPKVTPVNWNPYAGRVWSQGNRLIFTSTGSLGATPRDWTGDSSADSSKVYQVYVRVKVCDPGVGLESNCVRYGNNYKPEGLMQQYAMKIRYSAFGYVRNTDFYPDGGILRARMKFIGPNQPVPLAPNVVNPLYEWDSGTGVMRVNPDSTDASASGVGNSGVMNFLNKFGETGHSYKGHDNLSELYYAAIRYFKNQGNVTEWLSGLVDDWKDGFPVIATWEDPILYSCQKNFILGIGDINTHADSNLPGAYPSVRKMEPILPQQVSADTTVNVTTATNKVGSLETLAGATPWNGTGSQPLGQQTQGGTSNYYIAGLAYDSHTKDIRPDLVNSQTISTYWLDVVEYQTYASKNKYWLAAKYGGFNVPAGYDPYTQTTALPDSLWWTTGDMLTMTGANDKRPDNYFLANQADKMVSGLKKAFSSIAANSSAHTTAFSLPNLQLTTTGNQSYSSTYFSDTWTSLLEGQQVTFDASGNPVLATQWSSDGAFAAQVAGTGWNTARRIVTWSGAAGIPFRLANLTASQGASLNTDYVGGDDRSNYLNYLRGDRSNERSSTTDTSHDYRYRARILGDIVGAKVVAVGAPEKVLKDSHGNPGVEAFQGTWKNRPTVAYAGSNDGMLHAFDGRLSGASAGQEIFAYIPSALFAGPSSPSSPSSDGLAALGNPVFTHHYYVNATPVSGDVDFTRTPGAPITDTHDWRTLLVGGLGKGGRSYYALDITDPATITSETVAARRVLWEFTDSTLGYSFGRPIIAKTAKYGWVVILTSGYNNPDGKGYLYFVNPRTGALLERVSTNSGSATDPSGLSEITGFTPDYYDGTIDAVYGGDLQGNLWRFDLSASTGSYPAATRIARLTNQLGDPQPVTTRPLAEDGTLTVSGVNQVRRYVLVGTGRQLDAEDIASTTENTFYVIADSDANFQKCGDSFYLSGAAPHCTLPANVNYPVTRDKLQALTSLTTGITYSDDRPMGWYLDLGRAGNNVAWRVTTDPVADTSQQVFFTTTLPNGDVCSPSGTSRLYGMAIGSGKTAFDLTQVPAGYLANITGVITDLGVVVVDGETQRVIYGTDQGVVTKASESPVGSAPNFQLRNWREVPLVTP